MGRLAVVGCLTKERVLANDSSNPCWGDRGCVLPIDQDCGWICGNQGKVGGGVA